MANPSDTSLYFGILEKSEFINFLIAVNNSLITISIQNTNKNTINFLIIIVYICISPYKYTKKILEINRKSRIFKIF